MRTTEILAKIERAELTDEQLEMIAGGKGTADKIRLGFGVASGVGALGVASAAAAV